MVANAQEIDGIYYSLDSQTKEATVTAKPFSYYEGGDVNIPASVTYENVTYSVTGIVSFAFRECAGLTSISIPNSVVSIGECAFSYCSSLTTVTIPNSVTSIEGYAFYQCTGLTTVTIGSGVASYGDYTFGGCDALTSVTVKNETPVAIFWTIFSNCSNATLYVPVGCKAAYEAADNWNAFKNIVEIENINFADANVKALCVANWDTDGDGELSTTEAAAVTSLGTVFNYKKTITSFDELQYFTGLMSIGESAFQYLM